MPGQLDIDKPKNLEPNSHDNSKLITDLNLRVKSTKFLGKKIGISLGDLGLGKFFFFF